ncbi:MAG: NAD+ synthase [Methanotrichaceae archaeon]|nr:NAD+ synthase [Methanotrichaceae archaeon]
MYLTIGCPELKIEEFIKNSIIGAGANGAVIGLSGGIDSTLTAYLAVHSIGSEKIFGLILPEKGVTLQEDVEDAKEVCKILAINYEESDISHIMECYSRVLHVEEASKVVAGNLKARVRMTLLYWQANLKNLLVLGTGNKTEIMLGYSTKYGDAAADIFPLAGLFKKDVRGMAERLKIPRRIIDKKPTAGLWAGQTDEDELGITYHDADIILQEMEHGACQDDLVRLFGPARVNLVLSKIRSSQHKRELPPGPPMC